MAIYRIAAVEALAARGAQQDASFPMKHPPRVLSSTNMDMNASSNDVGGDDSNDGNYIGDVRRLKIEYFESLVS